VGQSRLGILVQQLAGRYEVAGDDIGRAAIQSREFAADFGGQLLGLDLRRYPRAFVACRLAIGCRLRPASPVRAR
jgi:hypothetical protein